MEDLKNIKFAIRQFNYDAPFQLNEIVDSPSEIQKIYDETYKDSTDEYSVFEIVLVNEKKEVLTISFDEYIKDLVEKQEEKKLPVASEAKKIRLEWESDNEKTWEDYIVPANTPSHIIQRAIDLSLLTHNNESEFFISVMEELGYKTRFSREEIETYDFNSIENTTLQEIDESEYNISSSLYNLLDSTNNKTFTIIEKSGEVKHLNKLELLNKAIDSIEKNPDGLEDELIKSLCMNPTQTALEILDEFEKDLKISFNDLDLNDAKELINEHQKELAPPSITPK